MAGRGQGWGAQTEKREWFARLIARGFNNSEACRIVGVNRKTGKRWRHGRKEIAPDGSTRHYAPVINTRAEKAVSARYLSEDQRVAIADLRRSGMGVRAIATELGRAPSTISRELRRNRDGRGQYRPFTAQRMAAQRRSRPDRGKLIADATLRGMVAGLLAQRWSPEQIAQALGEAFPLEPDRHLATETIYQAVYRPELGGLGRVLPRSLRTGRRRRRPRRHPEARRQGTLTNMVMIDQRPAEATDRTVAGNWEGDLITGAANQSAIVTVVERSSRFTVLGYLPDGCHTAEAVRDVLIEAFSGFPAHLCCSLTWDQGKEMALHRDITTALGMPVYFCEKASPWQRPSNENTNGLLRQYFPKGSDLRVHGPEELTAVAAELNTRPRKTLDWATPAARFARALAGSCGPGCCADERRHATGLAGRRWAATMSR